MKKQLSAILNKELDRKDFLKYSGVAMLMVAGGASILGSVERFIKSDGASSKLGATTNAQNTSMAGYGASPYGQ